MKSIFIFCRSNKFKQIHNFQIHKKKKQKTVHPPSPSQSLLFCSAGLRLLSNHTPKPLQRSTSPPSGLPCAPFPTAEISSGRVCEREPAREARCLEVPGPSQSSPQHPVRTSAPQELAQIRGIHTSVWGSMWHSLGGTEDREPRVPMLHVRKGNETLILPPSLHPFGTLVPTSVYPFRFLWGQASLTPE